MIENLPDELYQLESKNAKDEKLNANVILELKSKR